MGAGTVVLTELVKTYKDASGKDVFTAVKSINLVIADGEFMVLVGPSGCGKSTTLRMVAGLEDITSGTVRIGDTVVNKMEPKDRGIAMVFQNYALYPHMKVFENMAFGLRLAKRPKNEIQEKVSAAAKSLGLDTMLDRKPRALSGGQRQRVAVGRAIVRDPKVFLFDEPLSNLDAKMRVQMRSEISKLHVRLGTTMIYVTHDQVEAMTMGDRICVMKDGDIMQVADPMTLYREPENTFVAGFIGSPPMNLFPGRIESRGSQPAFVLSGGEDVRIPLSGHAAEAGARAMGRDVVFGIRPEDIGSRPRGDATAAIQRRIDLAEPMGAETLLYFMMGSENAIARMQDDRYYQIDEVVTVYLNLEKVHLFDAATDQVIR
jgi:multiple sugar transport system ATP-binding protein